jgi:hypothetical protein
MSNIRHRLLLVLCIFLAGQVPELVLAENLSETSSIYSGVHVDQVKESESDIETKGIDSIGSILEDRIEPDDATIRRTALNVVIDYPGDNTIEQVSAIFEYLRDGWVYIRDPRGKDYFNYANQSLIIGEEAGHIAAGDSDDFAILMSSLVESIGGTTRIILARNNSTGGHAYSEVYLGQLGAPDNQIEEIINWLKQKYNTDRIYTHIDSDTKDVWLNIDWSADENGISHPGGPFFAGDSHYIIAPRENFAKTKLNLPENLTYYRPT